MDRPVEKSTVFADFLGAYGTQDRSVLDVREDPSTGTTTERPDRGKLRNRPDTLVVIPARVASTRLPGKMLADIGGLPLIVRTYQSVVAANVGDVIVACDGEEIASVIRNAGGIAVLTDPDLPSGSDRVYAAYKECDPHNKYDFVINVQGDMPFVASEFIQKSYEVLLKSNCDISTIAAPIRDDSYLRESVVKPVIVPGDIFGKAIYFSRSPVPFGGPYYHHVGIYGFRHESLERFVSLPQGTLEKMEKLEQLRALENNMTIGIDVVDADPPISVDTPTDLEIALRAFSASLPSCVKVQCARRS